MGVVVEAHHADPVVVGQEVDVDGRRRRAARRCASCRGSRTAQSMLADLSSTSTDATRGCSIVLAVMGMTKSCPVCTQRIVTVPGGHVERARAGERDPDADLASRPRWRRPAGSPTPPNGSPKLPGPRRDRRRRRLHLERHRATALDREHRGADGLLARRDVDELEARRVERHGDQAAPRRGALCRTRSARR